MKGAVLSCLQEVITKDFGADKWKECLKSAGMKESTIFLARTDVPDAEVLALIKSTAAVTGLSNDRIIDRFGEYWSSSFAPNLYGRHFDKAKSAKELLMNLDGIHSTVRQTMPGANPPTFRYETQGDKVLIMHYESPRGLVAFMPAMIRGVAKYYNEKVDVQVTGNSIRVQFQ